MRKKQHEPAAPAQASPRDDFYAIVERQPEGVVILDGSLQVRYMNPAAVKLLGTTPGALTGSKFPYDFDYVGVSEVRVDHEYGKRQVLQIRCVEAEWAGEKALLLSLTDVHDRKREQELLQQAVGTAEARASELQALKFIADQLNQAALIDEGIQAGLETVLALLEAEAAWVLLPEETGDIRMIAAYSRSSFLKSEKRSLGAAFRCRGLELAMNGELSDPVLVSNADCMHRAGLSPNLPTQHYSISLISRDKPIGVLNLVPAEGGLLSARNADLLKTLSHQFSIAIQRSMPHSTYTNLAENGEDLDRISQVNGSALDLPAVLQNILKLAVELVGAEAGTLGLLSQNRQNLNFLTNLPQGGNQKILVADDNLVWQAVEKKESALIVGRDALQKSLPGNFCTEAHSMVLAPILSGQQSLGVLALYTTSAGRQLNAFDQAIAETLGQQAGVAVWNVQLFSELQQLIVTDSLTGLHNQKGFISHAVRELERTWRYKRPLSIISLVIDDIRSINEQYGRASGDRVIHALGRICTESLRRVDVVGRYTGNNFVILLPETQIESAREAAERLRAKVERFGLKSAEGTISFTISLGVAGLLQNEVIDLERFIDRANQALYTAVQMGGNRSLVWEPG